MKPSDIVTPEGRKRGTPPALAKLTPEQHALLVRWFLEGVTLETARVRVRDQFKISVSHRPLWRFYHDHAAPVLEQNAAAEPGKPLWDVLLDAAGVSVRIQVLAPGGAVMTTRGAK